jgi:CRISPR-associated endonuclease/helicase Cas3
MCAAHRLERIAEIWERVKRGDSCLVVSTQLVEAGVDLDFPAVFRAMAPLDSIAQAAGRCDREGLLTRAAGKPAGRVIVFEPEDGKLPSDIYREATDRTRALAAEGRACIDDPQAIREYFHRLYGEADLGTDLQRHRRELHFRTVSDLFQLIDDRTLAIFVPYDENARKLIAELRMIGRPVGRLLRLLRRYTVGLYPGEVQAGLRGAIGELVPGMDLRFCREGFYDPHLGIVLTPPAGNMVV